jgi:hypothetical protein
LFSPWYSWKIPQLALNNNHSFTHLIALCRIIFEICAIPFKVILHQFWVKQMFPWKFNLEYGGIFTKLFMHVSSRSMFPTTRNLQIRVHVYRPRHCCGDWLIFGCSDDCRSWPREEKINNHGCFVRTHTFLIMIIEESVCFMSCESFFFPIILMWYTRNICFYFF